MSKKVATKSELPPMEVTSQKRWRYFATYHNGATVNYLKRVAGYIQQGMSEGMSIGDATMEALTRAETRYTRGYMYGVTLWSLAHEGYWSHSDELRAWLHELYENEFRGPYFYLKGTCWCCSRPGFKDGVQRDDVCCGNVGAICKFRQWDQLEWTPITIPTKPAVAVY